MYLSQIVSHSIINYHMPMLCVILTSGGYAEVVSFTGGYYTATFTFPDISANILNNTQLRCADIMGDDNIETFYMAGNKTVC